MPNTQTETHRAPHHRFDDATRKLAQRVYEEMEAIRQLTEANCVDRIFMRQAIARLTAVRRKLEAL